ncbi:hypothetical protein AURANDRAFT_69028 [Aureococcus anophagefferens]|uniref:Sulfotransferase domain-containing protein n=1 Tax=Aureococcus anophagefferens TaxID=44056 RepID=F0YRI0_AURAN|nr:hypothetical protein AURANDRAFT_69028 [Aureococcus anophagefferens]EGB02279.1 hypothetical protein AURANDRAFT_69028 [Aureococcus anophagefferens]|eukprot:XP_009043021.1 hypothetical protein AURANDRAFT_69028 [Aureococcus anophagefferens]
MRVGVLVLAAAAAARQPRKPLEPPSDASSADLCPPCFELARMPAHGNRSMQALRWLHLPKSGSTFQNSVFHWACPKMPERAGYGPRATPFKLKSLYTKDRRLNRTLCDRDVDMTIPGHPPAEERALPRTVAMFRQPRQRVISAYRNGKHCDGFQEIDKDPNWKHLTVAEYARHAGIPGCTTRMLLGGKCARARHVTRDFDAAKAVANVRRLAFVGILERWRESICLFHKMHGGRPSAVEFGITHSTRGDLAKKAGLHEAPKPYDESVLEGVEDPDEDAVYAAALDVFDRQLRRHAPNCPRR